MPGGGAQHDDDVLSRLEDQAAYYEAKARRYARAFKGFKTLQIVAAAAIPVEVALAAPSWLSAALGALVVVVEGLQQLNQYQPLWVSYRATAEALKRERSHYLAAAGPYAASPDPRVLLAERVEALLNQEIAAWVRTRKDAAEAAEQKTGEQ